MAWDPVPWAINGASTDAAIARVLANIASNDAEGINLPGDFKVSALGTPGPQVSVAPGGMVVRNVQAPGESYVGISRSDTLVNIASTGGAARSDLLIAQIIDPDFSPWQPYTDPNQKLNGPYFQPVIISGVSPSTTSASEVVSYSAYALARIDMPANTINVDGNYIVDLRNLAKPRTKTVYGMQDQSGTTDFPYTQSTNINFPPSSMQVQVPEWATQAVVRIDITTLQCLAPASDAQFCVQFGTLQGTATTLDFNAPSNLGAYDAIGMPVTAFAVFNGSSFTALQGKTVTVQPMGFRLQSGNQGDIQSQKGRTQVGFTVHFDEILA